MKKSDRAGGKKRAGKTASGDSGKKTKIICIGHSLMGDDGVGPAVARILAHRRLPPDICVEDVGTSGFSIVHAVEGADAAVIVDACDFGGKTGDTVVIPYAKGRTLLSSGSAGIRFRTMHHGNVNGMLEIAEKTGRLPSTVLFYGIQPYRIKPSEKLSPQLKKRIKAIAGDILSTAVSLSAGAEKQSSRAARIY